MTMGMTVWKIGVDGDDDVDDRSGLAHAACASDGNDDGDDPIGVAMWMIGVASPIPLAPSTAMTMAMIRSERPRPCRSRLPR